MGTHEIGGKEFPMQCKTFTHLSCLVCIIILSFGVGRADGEERHHQWSAGLRGGPSFLTQDAIGSTNAEGQIGPIFNGVVVYDLHKHFSFGFEAEWEQHKIDQGSLTLGKASTASLLIRFECHLARTEPISPYFLLAGGYNLNSFSEDDAYGEACGEDCSIDIDNSFTMKAGFGTDLFVIFENAALNVEIAWKYNEADMDFFVGGEGAGSNEYSGSALTMLLGFRYHFPVSTF
jgi:hypothetical protein